MTQDIKTAIYRYCNYQDRCHQEVRNKLYELGATTTEVNELIAELIEANILNEERYARSIARGRFRLKKWGKIKITQHLKQNRVSEYCIRKAMTEIDYDEYLGTINKLAERKWYELRADKNVQIRKGKVFRYLAGKGFESSLISECLKQITDNN